MQLKSSYLLPAHFTSMFFISSTLISVTSVKTGPQCNQLIPQVNKAGSQLLRTHLTEFHNYYSKN